MGKIKYLIGVSAFVLALPAGALGTNDFVRADITFDFASREMFYGLPINREPVVIPDWSLTFFDWVSCGFMAYIDTTDWGARKHRGSPGYGDRAWQYQEFDPYVRLIHTFNPDEYGWLPVAIRLGVGFQYEYHPRFAKCKSGGVNGNPDTQLAYFYSSLPDLWLEPSFVAEFDVERDHGVYLNFGVGHAFPLIDAAEGGEDADPTLALRLDLYQGWGDGDRVEPYLGINECGFMDTTLCVSLEWRPVPFLKIAPYAAYCEYVFDRHLRDATRDFSYKGEHSTESWNFYGGIRIAASF